MLVSGGGWFLGRVCLAFFFLVFFLVFRALRLWCFLMGLVRSLFYEVVFLGLADFFKPGLFLVGFDIILSLDCCLLTLIRTFTQDCFSFSVLLSSTIRCFDHDS